VVDALSVMLESASQKGRIAGLVPHLVEGGITHLQYADDTVLMIQNEETIVNLKLILYCFESTSGMKISYHKSEVFVMGEDKTRREDIAAKFNCKLGSFPLTYLGILIHTRKLRKPYLQIVNHKMAKRAEHW
jgi:hypothetical protein